MEITNVKGSIKGSEFDHDIEKLTLITGSNEAGKTSIMDVVTLALRGWHPRVMTSAAAKNNRELLLLNDGKNMKAEIKFSDKSVAFVRASLGFEDKVTVKKQAPSSNIYGEETGTPMLDPNSYFSIGAKDRIRYVFSLVDLADLMDWEHIKKNILGDIAGQTDSKIREAFEAVFNRVLEEIEGNGLTDPKEILEKSLEVVSDSRKEFAAVIDRIRKTLQQAATEGGEGARVSIEATEQELKAKREEIAKITADIQLIEANKEKFDKSADRLEDIEKEMPSKESSMSNDEIESKMAGLEASLYGAVQEAPRTGEECENSRKSLKLETDEIFNELHEKELELATAKSVKDSKAEKIKDGREEISRLNSLESCPTCGSDHDGWKAKTIDFFEKAVTEVVGEFKAACIDHAKKSEVVRKLKVEQDALLEIEIRNDNTIDAIGSLQRALTANLTVSALVNERIILKKNMPESYDQDLLISLQTQLPIKQEEERTLTDLIANEQQHKAEEASLAKKETELMEFKEQEDVCAHLKKAFEKLKKDLCAKAFEKVLEPANAIFAGVLPFTMKYHNEEIGYFNDDGIWVTHRLWCGMEQLLGYSAIGIALAAQQPFKLLLVDDLGRLDPKTYELFLLSVERSLQQGLIDQFIGIAPTEPKDKTCVKYKHIEI